MIFNDLKQPEIKQDFVAFWNGLKIILPDGPDKTIVMRKLQEAYFYSCNAIVNDGEYKKKPKAELRNGSTVLNYNR